MRSRLVSARLDVAKFFAVGFSKPAQHGRAAKREWCTSARHLGHTVDAAPHSRQTRRLVRVFWTQLVSRL